MKSNQEKDTMIDSTDEKMLKYVVMLMEEINWKLVVQSLGNILQFIQDSSIKPSY